MNNDNSSNESIEWSPSDLEKICIVGIACKFPDSENVTAYWNNLLAGNNCVNQKRIWNDGYSATGGFLTDIDSFDANFFNISSHEATCMDPQQRLLLEASWHAIEDSGLSINLLQQMQTGVYATLLPSDYKNLLIKDPAHSVSAHSFTGNAPSAISGRISYFYHFNGPSLTIDTACSSGLSAINIARLSLQNSECQVALVGGVCAFSTSEFYQLATEAKMLSPTIQNASFDESADGFVPSEGVAMLVLMKLKDAVNHNLHIYAVVEDIKSNHNGSSNGIMSPNPIAQENLLHDTFIKNNIATDDIALIEAHGTATKVGDLVELKALKNLFSQHPKPSKCYLGASKTVIGHTLVCAGLASIIKVLLSYQHRIIPPNVHFTKPNINSSIEPFLINQTAEDWPENKCYAGVSAFGFTGSNAFLLLKFPQKRDYSIPHRFENFFVMSAENTTQLQTIVNNLISHIEAYPDIDLSQLSARLIQRPKHFKSRLALYAANSHELLHHLRQLILDTKNVQFCPDTLQNEAYTQLSKWLTHHDSTLDISGLLLGNNVAPFYPFKKTRYWVTDKISTSQPNKNPPIPSNTNNEDSVNKNILSSLGLFTKTIDHVNWVVSNVSGQPIILLPPLNTTYMAWYRQITDLHQKGFELHIPQYPTHFTDNTSNRDLILQEIASTIIQYIEKFRIKPHLVGWSLGGVISLLMAVQKSHLLKSLSLISTSAFFDNDLFGKTIEMQNELQTYQQYLSIVFNTKTDISKYISAKTNMNALTSYYKALMNLSFSETDLKKIRNRTLIIYGDRDPVLSEKQNHFLSNIENSIIKPYQRCGHFIPIIDTHQFNDDLMAFLTSEIQ